MALAACAGGPKDLAPPPTVVVTSPARSLVQNSAGSITVTGTATPNDDGTPIANVMVNNVAATVNPDGSFTASIEVEPGASLIRTVATDTAGGVANDTRSVEAGELRPPGSNIASAITASVSANGFTKISGIATTMIKQQDFGALLAPLQPMVHNGDESGPDCLYDQVFVDNLTFSDANISLVPVAGGLQFSAEIDGLDVPAHVNFAAACVNGSDTLEVTADKVIVTGTLSVTPNGMNGFTTTLNNPNVALTNFQLDAGGIPGEILNMIDMNNAIAGIIESGAEKFMGPMMNTALGSLAGDHQLAALGKNIDFAVAPSAVTFDDNGGTISLDTSFLIEGAESSPGYIFTDNGNPALDPGQGLELALADDLANEALAQITALDMLKLSMSVPGGSFDSIAITATSAPMISADPSDGQLKLFLPDMKLTFLQGTTPVADAALNATVALAIVPAANGTAVSVQLGTPTVYIDVLNDIPNNTHLEDNDLASAVKLSLDGQIATISALLGTIPLPSIAGITLRQVSVEGSEGYVCVKATIL
nr:hypothetical protein [Kofleriaceae bacterium]